MKGDSQRDERDDMRLRNRWRVVFQCIGESANLHQKCPYLEEKVSHYRIDVSK
jgi:hypothetical protein